MVWFGFFSFVCLGVYGFSLLMHCGCAFRLLGSCGFRSDAFGALVFCSLLIVFFFSCRLAVLFARLVLGFAFRVFSIPFSLCCLALIVWVRRVFWLVYLFCWVLGLRVCFECLCETFSLGLVFGIFFSFFIFGPGVVVFLYLVGSARAVCSVGVFCSCCPFLFGVCFFFVFFCLWWLMCLDFFFVVCAVQLGRWRVVIAGACIVLWCLLMRYAGVALLVGVFWFFVWVPVFRSVLSFSFLIGRFLFRGDFGVAVCCLGGWVWVMFLAASLFGSRRVLCCVFSVCFWFVACLVSFIFIFILIFFLSPSVWFNYVLLPFLLCCWCDLGRRLFRSGVRWLGFFWLWILPRGGAFCCFDGGFSFWRLFVCVKFVSSCECGGLRFFSFASFFGLDSLAVFRYLLLLAFFLFRSVRCFFPAYLLYFLLLLLDFCWVLFLLDWRNEVVARFF